MTSPEPTQAPQAPSDSDTPQVYAEVVRDKYEGTWAAARRRIQTHIAAGNELPTILARLGRLKFPGVRDGFWQKQPDARAVTKAVFRAYGADLAEGQGLYARVVGERFYPSSGYNPIAEIAQRIEPRTTVVVELGSGWSANLFQIYVWAGRAASESLTFVGAEYTEGGRECASLLADHEGRINFRSVAFDWTQPDLSWLAEIDGPKHVVAFSHHSIEQVPEIDPAVYAELARHADSATVLHFEPVSWQRDRDMVQRRRNDDLPYFRGIRRAISAASKWEDSPLDLRTVAAQHQVAAWWSFARKHNHNLLEAVESSRYADVQSTLFDFDSVSNPLNPTSLVELKVDCSA